MQKDTVDKNSGVPMYLQLMTILKNQISRGDGIFKPGDKIPSEQELCDQYGVSRVTVRKAMLDLVQEELLIRRQGKGTFVAEKRIERSIQKKYNPDVCFTQVCSDSGHTATTRLLSVLWEDATTEEAQTLQIPENSKVLEITRLRYCDNLPVTLEINRFSQNYSFLTACDLSRSLYEILKKKGHIPTLCEHVISLGRATPQVARCLQCDTGDALLLLDEVVSDQDGKPMYSGRQWIRGDKFTFRI